jgi:hypothetical protein
MTETVDFGGRVPDPKRRRYVVLAVIVAAVALAVVAVLESQAGWFDDKPKDSSRQIDHALPSTPRALTAAVLTHIPEHVTVVWSSASGGMARGTPGIGPAAGLRRSLVSSVLMRVGSDEFYLSVVTGPPHQALVPDALGEGLFTRDRHGRTIKETVAGSTKGNPTLITESASPTSHGELPLSDGELKAILADPLVGVQTDAATLARSRTLPRYTDSPPALTWKP